ncbi:D(2) dopamine receptor A-like [Ruditapes philippinarum]|uniref:D(2) dopamine receptor A-like n=1 Tax=Ruditapes philippinarum TaxID=129788 RepID=UPI00295BAAA1|nr:D(2) dopamine receptor A-like [Ruditapes philippinarum]
MDNKLEAFPNNSDFNPGQDSSQFDIPEWARSLQLTYMLLIFVVGLLGNGVVVFIQKRQKDKSSTDYLVLAMALLDLFSSGFITPFYMAQNIRSVWNVVFSGVFCKMKYFLVYGTNISSTTLFAALAFDRYMRTCHPLSLKYMPKTSKIMSIVTVLISFAIALFSIYVFEQNDANNSCGKVNGTQVFDIVMTSFLTAAFVLLFGMAVFCYTKITLKIRRQAREGRQRRSRALGPTSRIVRLFKPKKVETLILNELTQSSGRKTDTHLKTLSTKSTALDASGSCCQDSTVDKQETGNDGSAFESRVDRKTRNVSEDSTVAQTDSTNLTSNEKREPPSVENPDRNTKKQYCKEKFRCIHCGEIDDVQNSPKSACHHQNDEQLLQPNNLNLKQRTHKQQCLRKMEDSTSMMSEREKKEIRKVNYVTFMMFTITATYVLTWVTTWVMYAIFDQTTVTGRVVLYLTKTSFVVNYIATPLFFTLMSTQFRARVKSLVYNIR